MAALEKDLQQWSKALKNTNNFGDFNELNQIIQAKTGKNLKKSLESTNFTGVILAVMDKDPKAMSVLMDNMVVAKDNPNFINTLIAQLQF
jgi:hypothetical protein